MDLPSPFKVPSVPGTPLYALSPERINQQRIPQSPSLPGHLSETERKHHRNSSDVRSKVEFLNSLAGQNPPHSPTRQNAVSAHAALQRAMLGREEAEAQLTSTAAQLQESQSRELRIAERIESLMEELQTVKERQVHERQVFEKEVRKARKEAFKASSVLVQAQEELKESRAEVKSAKAEAQHERLEKEKARQEAFERAYALAGLMEEMEVVREKLKSVQGERDAAQLQAQMDEVPNVIVVKKADAQVQTDAIATAAPIKTEPLKEGLNKQIATQELQGSRPTTSERMLPVESPEGPRAIDWRILPRSIADASPEEGAQEEPVDLEGQLLNLKGELRWQRTLRERADETIHLLQMECQFKVCACRMAEARGEKFTHDSRYDEQIQAKTADRKRKAQEVPQSKAAKQARKSDSLVDSFEPTAVLEDMTQVLVETNPHQQQFSFSTSTNSNFYSTAPTLRAEQTFSHPGRDLFDLSPPKPAPVRPSTSLGIRTPASPIRMVPESPRPRPSSQTPPSNQARTRTVPLREPTSPLRHSVRAATRSPSFSATPGPLTSGLQMPHRPNVTHTISTTTTVPLRGLDSDDVFSPHVPATPGTPISREAALAQIRARRDRARSVNLKSVNVKGNATPGSAKRGVNAVMFGERAKRDVSQASAPGRI